MASERVGGDRQLRDGFDFDGSVSDAVSAGLLEVERLGKIVGSVIGRYCLLSIKAEATRNASGDFALEFDRRHRWFCEKVRAHLTNQRQVLSTFNIVFFGRTGAGKSTLLSAFGELDGSAVSPGESDWTVESSSVRWKGCRLYDTPGINGWGRSKSREDLEATARKAVEVADVVVLCFDSQSQQASEFVKVAEWVRHFGKPTIAVLNNRNLRWRHPAKVPDQIARRNVSVPVRQHAANIRGELANIGLSDTPVVAIHSRRALFARASTPYQGPGKTDFNHEREAYGLDYLARWSNFAVLEALISAGIASGGADLRLMSLREGIRTLLRDEASELTRLSDRIVGRIAELDRAIELHLETLGYLEEDERVVHLHDENSCGDLLTLVETVRRTPYRAPAEGAFSRQVRNLVKPHLSEPRNKALRRFRKLEEDAFEKKHEVDGEHFKDAVFVESEITAALQEVWLLAARFLQRELSIASAELRHGSVWAGGDTASFDGRAGVNAQTIESLLLGGNLLGGAVLTGALAAIALNWWNPAGWVGGVALAGAGLINWGIQALGNTFGDTAEKQRAAARAKAYRAGATAVFETFDRIEETFIRDARTLAWKAAVPAVAPLLREFLTLSALRDYVVEMVQGLQSAAEGILPTLCTNVFSRAEMAVAEALDVKQTAGASVDRVLLGEDWFDHEKSAEDRAPEELQALAHAYRERDLHDSSTLRRALTEAFSEPDAASIVAWRSQIAAAAADNETLAAILAALRENTSRSKVAVVGDYSSGKSSFIKRLLVELTGTAPESLLVRAEPTTDSVRIYPLPDFDVIDTPGFQSGREDHDERATAGAEGSVLTIVLFQVNLLIGNTAALEQIVKGSHTSAGIWPRVFFVINRCDEIGVDPDRDASEYLSRVDLKKAELHAALKSRGIDIDLAHIHGIASDPFGSVGQQWPVMPADYNANRIWDGVAPLVTSLRTLSGDVLTDAQRIADFDRLCSCLLTARVDTRAELETLRAQADTYGSVIRALTICLEDADYLSRKIEQGLTEKISRHAAYAVERVRAVRRDDTEALAKEIVLWVGDEALVVELCSLTADSCELINEWVKTHQSAIGREFGAAKFSGDLGFDAGEAPEWASAESVDLMNAGRAAKAARKLAAAAGNRDAVYGIGKAAGHKFKPWGAVKGGKNVARVGVVLQAAVLVIDAASWYQKARSKGDWEERLVAAEQKVDETSRSVVEQILRGEDGPLLFLDERRELVQEILADTRRQQDLAGAEVEECERRLSVIEALLTAASQVRKGIDADARAV
jgi:putative ribosome biogenesis GTPase RsgA